MATDFSKYGTPVMKTESGVDFSKYGVPTSEVESTVEPEKKNSFLSNLVKAPLTILARPIQAVAALGGAKEEDIDRVTKKLTGGLVAPTPKNFSDVKKDVGRGIQTAALGLGPVSGGAAFGVGNSLEQGNDLFSTQTLTQGGIGAIGGKVLDIIGKPLLDVAGKVVGKISPQVLRDVASKGTQAVEEFASRHNILPETISKAINTTANKTESLVNKPFDVGSIAVRNMTTRSEKQIESSILQKYEKGVRPLLPGKTSPSKLQNYRDDVVSAIKTIKENQPNLRFNDADSIEIVGETPKSLQQFSDAIEQTKRSIYNQYDSLAKQAGEAGISVETTPIASELNTVINNKALALTNPNAIRYAKATQARYANIGKLDAETAQEVIQNYNKSLEAFYRNPGYDTASQAAIDAMIANRMRQSLDEGITRLTGTQYGALKRQYGSLKSIEKDVIKATIRDARKSTKGLIDFTDILTGGDITTGLLTMNPAAVARGIGGRGIKEFYKYLNDPNRAIEKMFSAVDDYSNIATYRNITRSAPKANPKIQTTALPAKTIGLSSENKRPTMVRKQKALKTPSNTNIKK